MSLQQQTVCVYVDVTLVATDVVNAYGNVTALVALATCRAKRTKSARGSAERASEAIPRLSEMARQDCLFYVVQGSESEL